MAASELFLIIFLIVNANLQSLFGRTALSLALSETRQGDAHVDPQVPQADCGRAGPSG